MITIEMIMRSPTSKLPALVAIFSDVFPATPQREIKVSWVVVSRFVFICKSYFSF
jgi:hypothetical protein